MVSSSCRHHRIGVASSSPRHCRRRHFAAVIVTTLTPSLSRHRHFVATSPVTLDAMMNEEASVSVITVINCQPVAHTGAHTHTHDEH